MVGAAGSPPVLSSHLSVTHHWTSAPPSEGCYAHPCSPDLQTHGREDRPMGERQGSEGGCHWLRVARVSGIHSPLIPLQGFSLSSVWMGALSPGHDTMRGPGSAAVPAFHVSI